MLRRLVLCATVAALAFSSLVTAVPSAAAESPSAPASTSPDAALAFADALARVPNTGDTRSQFIGYVDYRAVEAARPGAARPTSWAALEALRAADDPSARLWTAAYMGIASGSSDLLRAAMTGGDRWPDLLGFDFFDVDRAISFGAPPADGDVLFGRFDPAAIASAFARRGFTATDEGGGRTLLCGQGGCDAGAEIHADRRDPSNPFGGMLGRDEPLGVSATELDSSAALATVYRIMDAPLGTTPALGDDPSYRAAAETASADGTLIQATLVPGETIPADLTAALVFGDDAMKAELDRIAGTFTPIPAYDLVLFSDGATDSEQIIRIGLVYENAADAQEAVDAIPGRLDTLPSLVTRTPLKQLFDDRGVTSVEGRVVPSSDGARSVALFTLRAPLASNEPDPGTGRVTSSSLVYRMLVNMLFTRDLLWLAPALPTVI
jgi:hypothetical protein